MGTPMQNQNNAVLNALEEGSVATIIQLYDAGHLRPIDGERYSDIIHYLHAVNMKDEGMISYWLNWFRVKPEGE